MRSLLVGYILRGVLPTKELQELDSPGEVPRVVRYVENSISLSPIWVRGPEKILRLGLFFLLLLFHFLEIVTFNRIDRGACIRFVSKIHPAIDDGIRLYSSLGMFGLFEEDSYRSKKGFLSHSQILSLYSTNDSKSADSIGND